MQINIFIVMWFAKIALNKQTITYKYLTLIHTRTVFINNDASFSQEQSVMA
jgi:hypothetical protein